MFCEKYEIFVYNDYVAVKTKNFNRPTFHLKNQPFSLLCSGRKIKFTPEVIKIWEKSYKDKHLVEIQNAVNALLISYQQELSEEDINKMLIILEN